MKKWDVIWFETSISELSYGFIGGIRVEKLITKYGERYSIGKMETSLIKFNSFNSLWKFLTV